MIHTKLHDALETAYYGTEPVRGALSKAVELLHAMEKLPHYVFGVDLMQNLDLGPLANSMKALHEAGVMKLPFPEIALELWGGEPHRRLLAVVTEAGFGNFKASVVEWSREPNVEERISHVLRCDFIWKSDLPPAASEEEAARIYPPRAADRPGSGWDCTFASEDNATEEGEGARSVVYALSMGVMMSVLLVNIAGLEREVVDTKKLNKSRASSGKKPIHDHTVVRIGHVYNSSGQRVAYDRGDGTRKPMRVHMRAAHTRRQQHGPDFLSSLEGRRYAGLPSTTDTHHVVLIDAVLVNYRDGAELEKPLPKVVRF